MIMAGNTDLKAAITAVIKQNGNNEITGMVLQNVLISMINSLGASPGYSGIANIATNPGTPDGNVFYFASQPGIYPNFGGLEVLPGEIAIISNTATGWTKTTSGIASNLLEIWVAATYMAQIGQYPINSLTGEAFNGGSIDIEAQTWQIPAGSTGATTYVQKTYNPTLAAQAINNGGSVRVLHKVKYNIDEPGGVSYGVFVPGTGITQRQICKYKVGDYIYILRELSGGVANTSNLMRVYVQSVSTSVKTKTINCEFTDAVVYVTDEKTQRQIQNTALLAFYDIYPGMTGQILKRMLDNSLSLRPSTWTGEALNGGIVDIAKRKYTIPANKVGNATYIQGVFENSNELLEKLTYGDVYGVMTVKVSDIKDMTYNFSTGLRGQFGANINSGTIRLKHPTDPNVFYYFSKIDKTKAYITTQNFIVFPLQIPNVETAVKTYDRTFEIKDLVFFVNEQSDLNVLFQNRQLQAIHRDNPGILNDIESPLKAIDIYNDVDTSQTSGTLINSSDQYIWTLPTGTNMYGVNFNMQILKLMNIRVGDKLVFYLNIKERKNATYDLNKLQSAAYFRINKTSPVVVYFYNNNAAVVRKTTKVNEDEQFNYFIWEATITITQTFLTAILDPTFRSIEVALMDATQRSLADYYNLIITMYVGKMGNTTKFIEDVRHNEKMIHSDISQLKKVIGQPYNVNYVDALASWKTILTTGTNRAKGYTVAAGQSELNNVLEVCLDWQRFFGKTPTQPYYDIFLNYNGTGDETFLIEVFDEKYNKIGVGSYWHDVNNNYIRVDYPISGFSDMPRVIVRVTATSALKKGFTIYYDHTVILGYGELPAINDRLLALEGSGQPNIVTAPNGSKWQIIVDNEGNLSTQNFYFSKMLVITHSYGYHGASASLGWYPTEPWGMMASAQDKDYVHRLLAKMQTVNPDTEISHIVNVATFEQNHQNPNFDFSAYDYLNTYDFDVIVIKIGENAGSKWENMANHIIELVDNHVGKNKTFKLFIASMFAYSTDTWDNLTHPMNVEFGKVAAHYGTRLAMINRNGGTYGNLYNGYNPANLLPPKPDGQQPDKATEVNPGVLLHPGDTGMDMIAVEYWDEVKRVYKIV